MNAWSIEWKNWRAENALKLPNKLLIAHFHDRPFGELRVTLVVGMLDKVKKIEFHFTFS